MSTLQLKHHYYLINKLFAIASLPLIVFNLFHISQLSWQTANSSHRVAYQT